MPLTKLTLEALQKEAKKFCDLTSKKKINELYGVTDGKAVGTFIEHLFQNHLATKYEYEKGNSANGIDLPSKNINTDIKVTSIKQPQSSCPFKSTRQKIYGLGYNLLLFVYEKTDFRDKKEFKKQLLCNIIKVLHSITWNNNQNSTLEENPL